MDDPKLSTAMERVNEAFGAPEPARESDAYKPPAASSPLDTFDETLESAGASMVDMRREAAETIARNEALIERIDIIQRAIHAAKTELTRP